VSDDLPTGWTLVPAAEVFSFVTSGSRGWAQYYSDDGALFLRVGNLPPNGIRVLLKDLQHVRLPPLAAEGVRTRLADGDILVSITADLGRVAVYADHLGEAYVNQHVALARPRRDVVEPDFMASFLSAPAGREQLQDLQRGATKVGLGLNDIRSVQVPLPPLNEQRRIVAKLEDLLARSRRAKDVLDAIPPLLEKLRQSILASAFRGDLTADWRAKHPDVEPAHELLKRIRVERRKKWEEGELGKMRAKGKVPADDRWKAKYQEPEPVNSSDLPELPDGWCWATLGDVAPLQAGYAFPSSGFAKGGVRLLKGNNVRDEWIADEDINFWEATDAQRFGDFLLNRGDIVLAMDRPVYSSGSKRTKVARLGLEWDGSLLLQRVGRFQRNQWIVSEYLWHFVISREFRDHLTQQQKGTQDGKDLPHVSATTVDQALLPLAPLDEQREIASRVGAALGVATLRSNLGAKVLSHVVNLDKALLAKAFRGELVEQDPNDEPASVMLERLASERTASESATPARGSAKREKRARSWLRARSSSSTRGSRTRPRRRTAA